VWHDYADIEKQVLVVWTFEEAQAACGVSLYLILSHPFGPPFIPWCRWAVGELTEVDLPEGWELVLLRWRSGEELPNLEGGNNGSK